MNADERRWEKLSGQALGRLVARWPKAIRREIREKTHGALCGHGENLSPAARRRWRYLLQKIAKIKDGQRCSEYDRDGKHLGKHVKCSRHGVCRMNCTSECNTKQVLKCCADG